jgi:hypothetical protein
MQLTETIYLKPLHLYLMRHLPAKTPFQKHLLLRREWLELTEKLSFSCRTVEDVDIEIHCPFLLDSSGFILISQYLLSLSTCNQRPHRAERPGPDGAGCINFCAFVLFAFCTFFFCVWYCVYLFFSFFPCQPV